VAEIPAETPAESGPPLPPPPPPPPPARRIAGLTCASCGGSLEVEEGLTSVVCRYCGTPQAVVGRRGVRRLMVLDQLPRADAEAVVRRWFAKGIRKEPALKRETTFDEAFLAWFPFVRARCDVVGWVLGATVHRKKRGKKWVTETRPTERQIEETVDATIPAAEMAEFGVGRVDLAGDAILPFDGDRLRARGMVFRPVKAAPELADALLTTETERIARRTRPQRLSFEWFRSLRRRVDLVYYPLWVFRYRFRDRTYQVLVDAEDGALAYGKAPGNHLWRAFAVIASCAGASFIGTTVFRAALGAGDDGGVGLIVASTVILGALVHWGYRQFRHGGVVEDGTGRIQSGVESPLAAMAKAAEQLQGGRSGLPWS
jgi:predicted RNA-binding Zn-ribbon protein involved in translation (DUF1610 family)